VVIVDDHSSAIEIAVHPASPFEPPVGEATPFQCANQFSDWCIAKLVENVRRNHRVMVTTGVSTTLTPS
jgi:hypothetical protein